MALLSIITVTYNAEAFLYRTLRSVQAALDAQPAWATEIEYLLIDGASKDATLEIAAGFGALLTTIVSEPDKGLYDAMNKGLSRATGAYVWFLNAGDELYSTQAFDELMRALHEGVDIAYSDAMYVDNLGRELGLRSVLTPHALPRMLSWRSMAYGMKVCHQAFVVKRVLAPPYWTDNLSADIDWEVRCLKNATMVRFLTRPLCRYLTGGLSVQKHRESLRDRYVVLRHHFGFFPNLLHHGWIVLRALLHSLSRRLAPTR